MFTIPKFSAPRALGYTIVTPLDGGPARERETLRCVHMCGLHWEVQPGSGRRRGWCMNCNGPTCGRPCCDPCVPHMKFIECVEAGVDPFNAPVKVHVPTDVPEAHVRGGILLGSE